MADPRTVAPTRPAMAGASQPDIYDLLAEDRSPAELCHLVVRDDATGPVARYAGQQANTEALTRQGAEQLRSATPNGQHMDIVRARTCPTCGRVHYAGMAQQVGRFQPDRPATFRADYPDAPDRSTRVEAIADMCRYLKEVAA